MTQQIKAGQTYYNGESFATISKVTKAHVLTNEGDTFDLVSFPSAYGYELIQGNISKGVIAYHCKHDRDVVADVIVPELDFKQFPNDVACHMRHGFYQIVNAADEYFVHTDIGYRGNHYVERGFKSIDDAKAWANTHFKEYVKSLLGVESE